MSDKQVVFIAEDEEDFRELLVQCFTEAGFTVASAMNGAEAVELATSRSFDALVIDFHMPIMDGWEATRRIRAALGASAYILGVTAHVGSAPSSAAAYEAGVDDVVAKPITPDVLIDIVRAALRTR